ncbi:hypothetical protein NDN08_005397 [Rhodosorus marinus]|uniref:Uncharacterized protein n=1 Tax=Rhodosorus marinus TaxID=101924 RepID=A0AAV8V4G6_9RHOD|nr:hypothetical protein NDN08_005397 [Rhodosorus marinus]
MEAAFVNGFGLTDAHGTKACKCFGIRDGVVDVVSANSSQTRRTVLESEVTKPLKRCRSVLAKMEIAGSLLCGRSQKVQNGLYIESSIRYIETKSSFGYGTLMRAWNSLKESIGWSEYTTTEARMLGLPLRTLRESERYGRHVVCDPRAIAELSRIAGDLNVPKPSAPESYGNPDHTIELPRLPAAGNTRSVAAKCPNVEAHRNGDRHPSLILWMNADGRTGGGQCQVCCGSEGKPIRYSVWYSGNSALLYRRREKVQGSNKYVLDIAVKPKVKGCRNTVGEEGVVDQDGVPVGGYVMSADKLEEPMVEGNHVCALLKNLHRADGSRTKFRTIGHLNSKDPIEILEIADRMSRSDKSLTQAKLCSWMTKQAIHSGDECEDLLYTRMLSTSGMVVSSWKQTNGKSGQPLFLPNGWEPLAQRWILFDLDDLQMLCEAVVNIACNKVNAAVQSDVNLSGRLAVVQTGPNGLQVWCELREVREKPRKWVAEHSTREWYKRLGRKILRSARSAGARGGSVDLASYAAGRFGRRPGWRVLERGDIFRSRLLYARDERGPNRDPRL